MIQGLVIALLPFEIVFPLLWQLLFYTVNWVVYVQCDFSNLNWGKIIIHACNITSLKFLTSSQHEGLLVFFSITQQSMLSENEILTQFYGIPSLRKLYISTSNLDWLINFIHENISLVVYSRHLPSRTFCISINSLVCNT